MTKTTETKEAATLEKAEKVKVVGVVAAKRAEQIEAVKVAEAVKVKAAKAAAKAKAERVAAIRASEEKAKAKSAEITAARADKVKALDASNTNPLKVPFAQDPQGSCKALREGGLRAVSRAAGSDDRTELLIDTLERLAAYAKTKNEAVKAERLKARENAANAAQRVAEKQKRIADEKLATLVEAAKKAQAVAQEKADELSKYESKE